MDTKRKSAITIRLDVATKEAARKVFESLGMDMSTGINVYLKQVARDQGLPFRPTTKDTFNVETESALKDLDAGRYKDFSNLEDLFKDLHNED